MDNIFDMVNSIAEDSEDSLKGIELTSYPDPEEAAGMTAKELDKVMTKVVEEELNIILSRYKEYKTREEILDSIRFLKAATIIGFHPELRLVEAWDRAGLV